MRAPRVASIVVWLAVTMGAATAWADLCPVPSAPHPTIQSAVDDLTCTEIVLAAETFVESVRIGRDLDLHGAGSSATFIEGRVVILGATTQVQLGQMTVDAGAPSAAGCYGEAIESSAGAEVSGNDLVARNACLIFADGFESGGTSQWSSSTP
jgi:hypothetical protein